MAPRFVDVDTAPVIKDMDMAAERTELGADQLWTVTEVAQHMRVSNMTVYRLIKSGDLPAIRVGKNYRIRNSHLDEYLAGADVNAN